MLNIKSKPIKNKYSDAIPLHLFYFNYNFIFTLK